MAVYNTRSSSRGHGSGLTGGQNTTTGGSCDSTKDQIAEIAAALAPHDVPAHLFIETQYVMNGLTSKQYANLLKIFNGKDEQQIAFTFTAGTRNRMWTWFHAINFPTWLSFLNWISSAEGQNATANVNHEEQLVQRHQQAFAADQPALLSCFDPQRNDFLQSEKQICIRHEEITQNLIQQQRVLMEKELAEVVPTPLFSWK